MKVCIIASFLVAAISAFILEESEDKFLAFKLMHGKTYKNQAEESKRFSIFKDNIRSIEEHNALYELGLVSYKQGVTKFADLTQEEFRTILNLKVPNKPQINGTKYVSTGVSADSAVDWRQKGQVTEVKSQENCGSCWAFSVVGSTEAAYFRKSGNLVSLSAQQLVDCTLDINGGCNGGYLEQTFPYVQETGLATDASYPYTGEDGQCALTASEVVAKIDGYEIIEPENEDALLDAVSNVGPISVAMDAGYMSFYYSGIYQSDECSPAGLNHGVLIVGYGSENGVDYWIVKNSWGAEWGEEGYFRILRGTNECGIAEDITFPVIN